MVIPDKIEGLPVTTIGDWAFFICSSLTGVTIPDTVTSIGDGAFAATGLTRVTIPDRITDISQWAFAECTGLTSVTIGNSVSSIETGAFENCTSVVSIEVGVLNPTYCSLDGVLFNKRCTSLVYFPRGRTGHYTIPDTITSIGDGDFSGCIGLTSVSIPDGVTWIGDGAFSCCTGLTSVSIPDGVTWIGNGAYEGCTSLTSIAIPNGVTAIRGGTFAGCSSLTNVVIPNSVTVIDSLPRVLWPPIGAFSGCIGLTSITIPNGVTTIMGGAFSGCSNLSAVTIGKGIRTLGSSCWRQETHSWCIGALGGCSGLNAAFFMGSSPNGEGIFCIAHRLGELEVSPATVYYLPGTIGWGSEYVGRPTAIWVRPDPVILDFGPSFGVQPSSFGFRISWATNANVVVEASADLANPTWSSVSTNTLTDGWVDFTDPDRAQYPARFYRVRGE